MSSTETLVDGGPGSEVAVGIVDVDVPGSDPDYAVKQLLVDAGVDLGILEITGATASC